MDSFADILAIFFTKNTDAISRSLLNSYKEKMKKILTLVTFLFISLLPATSKQDGSYGKEGNSTHETMLWAGSVNMDKVGRTPYKRYRNNVTNYAFRRNLKKYRRSGRYIGIEHRSNRNLKRFGYNHNIKAKNVL